MIGDVIAVGVLLALAWVIVHEYRAQQRDEWAALHEYERARDELRGDQ